MTELDYKSLYEVSNKHNEQLVAEIQQLKRLLEEMQANLQSALEGNTELRQQMKLLQEKLDRILAQKKNRDRKEFDTKNEGHNPRPEPSSPTRKARPPAIFEGDGKDSEKLNFVNSPTIEPEILRHKVAETDRICPHCHVETVFLGEKVTNQLERLVHSLKRLEHRQEVRSCPRCKAYIATAAKPTPPIPGSYAGPGLLGHMVVNKVDDALPNNRQEKMFAREAVPVPRSTQCDWFIALSVLVTPLYDLLIRELLSSEIVQTDDVPLKVQDRSHRKNIRKAKLTGYRGDSKHKVVVFDFSPDLTFARNRQFLRDFSGIVQADAAGGFDALFKEDSTKTEAGCHAHARRRIYDAKESSPKIAERMLDIYSHLFQVEKEARGKPPPVRLALRRKYSKPLMKKLRIMHIRNQRAFSPSHLLVDAANYALRHWRALTRFLKNPGIELSNNSMEREIKPVVLARKNILFAGSDAGGRALAIHRSLVASAKRNGLNPVEYLTDIFSRINDMKTSELYQLLPDRWADFRKPKSK
jgi:transposase